MCMFTFANISSLKARVKGVEKFECGACPECLQKKSRKWALRCSMEAMVSPGVMVTLTYDSYKNGINGEENPVDTTLSVNKKHCQDFIKRLRKHFPNQQVKYLLTAEYGKRTHRAHYHALLFNVNFNDLIQYKKSKRNNIIYKSKQLEKIWKHGICTVDAINLNAKIARYCTKYCAKDSGVEDTFMLFSHGIGNEMLKKKFNGLSYWIEGREYSIPRDIWQWYIENKYNLQDYSNYKPLERLEYYEKKHCSILDRFTRDNLQIETKMAKIQAKIDKKENQLNLFKRRKSFPKFMEMLFDLKEKLSNLSRSQEKLEENTSTLLDLCSHKFQSSCIGYHRQQDKREIYFAYRDRDPLYQRYLRYWSNKNKQCEFSRPSEFERISMLPSNKYWSYKQKALQAKARQFSKRSFVPPRSNCHSFDPFYVKKEYGEKSFAPLSRHYTANDTIREKFRAQYLELCRLRKAVMLRDAVALEVSPF